MLSICGAPLDTTVHYNTACLKAQDTGGANPVLSLPCSDAEFADEFSSFWAFRANSG